MVVQLSALAAEEKPPSRWEADISAFEAADKVKPPPKNGILFIGSSSIRLWDLKKSFPELPVINRGFGGSHLSDSVAFLERIVLPYAPRSVLLYAGDNDLNDGKSPERVLSDFKEFVGRIGQKLPETHIFFIAIKPSPSRAHLLPQVKRANELIAEYAGQQRRVEFIDIESPMLRDGQPRPELFVKDQLHLNEQGYELWTGLVREALKKSGAIQ